jgi:hypothetical protein
MCSLVVLSILAATTVVSAQGTLSTFPATPLASKHFAYPSGIVRFLLRFLSYSGLANYLSIYSLKKSIPTQILFAANNSVTTFVILPPKIKIQIVKLLSSTLSPVTLLFLLVLPLTDIPIQISAYGAPPRQTRPWQTEKAR